MAGETILEETISTIEAILGDDLAGATIERVVIGLFFTGVKLTSGHVGTCATPAKSIPEAVCCPSSALAMPFPGKMRGRPALDLVKETSSDHPIRRAVGIAALNALAAQCHALRPDPRVIAEIGVDAFDAANIRDGELTVVVGAFVPFLRELRRRGQSYLVLERDPSTLKQEEMACYRPASEMRNVVPQADVLLVTGTTLINDTLEDILAAAAPHCRKVVVGPTVGLVPDAFLRRGCSILGGTLVTEPDEFLDILAEGGSGYHFFGKSAQKFVLRASNRKDAHISAWPCLSEAREDAAAPLS